MHLWDVLAAVAGWIAVLIGTVLLGMGVLVGLGHD